MLQALRWLTANIIVCTMWGTLTAATGPNVEVMTVVFYIRHMKMWRVDATSVVSMVLRLRRLCGEEGRLLTVPLSRYKFLWYRC